MVNLDPAADSLPYEPDIDVRELIRVEDAMREFGYGPNGGLIYCMEYLAMHLEWLEDKISEFGEDDTLLFDCPGQIELYTHLRGDAALTWHCRSLVMSNYAPRFWWTLSE